jgi:hypothetical protein
MINELASSCLEFSLSLLLQALRLFVAAIGAGALNLQHIRYSDIFCTYGIV